MQQVPVSDLTRKCHEAFICENALMREAAELLVVHNLSVLVVQNEAGNVVGVLPEATVIRHLMQTTRRDELASQLMSRHVETVRSDAELSSILHLFRSSCHAVVPVVDDSGQSFGMLHRTDVVRYLLAEAQDDVAPTETQTETPEGRKPHFIKRPDAKLQPPPTSDKSNESNQG